MKHLYSIVFFYFILVLNVQSQDTVVKSIQKDCRLKPIELMLLSTYIDDDVVFRIDTNFNVSLVEVFAVKAKKRKNRLELDFYPNGKVKSIGKYKRGKKHGLWVFFDFNNKVIIFNEWRKDILIKTYSEKMSWGDNNSVP
jgi:hypothetical protein